MKTPFLRGPIPFAISVLLISLSSLISGTCYGQFTGMRTVIPKPKALPVDSFQLDFTKDIAVQLMAFDDIYEVAVSRSPVVNYQNEVSSSLNSAYQLSKLEILNRASGFVNYSTGNQAIISSGDVPGTIGTIGQISNGYRVGVNLQVSVYDLFGRPHLIRQAKANYQAAQMQKETIKLQLKHELITIYQDLVTAQQVLKLRIQEEQTALTIYQVAEIEARQGGKKPDELATAYSRYAQ
ncbi:MAG: TolC family protein, partial [Bacteroidetes bacterium]|nr:TolC family protein [Fibrella sp.]